MLNYLDVLADLHQALQPRSYLEIGVFSGDSFRLAQKTACRVGVDPEPDLEPDDPCRSQIEIMTSDAFFASSRPRELFGDRSVDMVFVDGMHLFEYALRDFANAEAIAGPASLIVLHDCLPQDAVTAARERTTLHWTGDVWKLPICLLGERADLDLAIVDVPPSGLCLVRSLDPGNRHLHDRYEHLVEKYGALDFADWEARRADVLGQTTHTAESRLWSRARELDARLDAAEAEIVRTRAVDRPRGTAVPTRPRALRVQGRSRNHGHRIGKAARRAARERGARRSDWRTAGAGHSVEVVAPDLPIAAGRQHRQEKERRLRGTVRDRLGLWVRGANRASETKRRALPKGSPPPSARRAPGSRQCWRCRLRSAEAPWASRRRGPLPHR